MAKNYINDGWFFTEKFDDSLLKMEYKGIPLKEVRLPHTCKELPFHYFDESEYQMVSGYRRIIKGEKEYEGKRVFITFEGIGHSSDIYLNGKKIGEHRCGYTALRLELTDQLLIGEDNVLAVRVDSNENLNIPPFGYVIDYMTYGGIYREVYLEVKNKDYLKDVFVSTTHNSNGWTINTETEIDGEASEYVIRQYLKQKGSDEFELLNELTTSEGKINTKKRIGFAKEWSPEEPNLYEIKTELIKNGEIIDESTITFGFRVARFKKTGFYLNGRRYRIRGLNRHQSYPYVGYAVPESIQKMDADVLKYELGLNAVRTSHYPQSHHFLDRCDEIGLLVFTEIPGWQHIGNDAWKTQAVENVKDMILQYRNHTSIILWGVRINESQDDDEFYIRTNEVAHALDSTRPTGGVRCIKNSHLFEDVYTYNDFVHNGENDGCTPKKKVTSDNEKPYLISEYNGHMFPTKAYDCEEHRLSHALRHANVINAVYGEQDIAGSFGWCMADYNTHKDFGSGDRICYHGVMDMFRNPKMAAYVYACEQDGNTVLEISTSMDIGEHPESNRGETYIFTNADSVRMFKNNIFIKEYTHKDSKYQNLKRGPILIDDFVGDQIEKEENFTPDQAKQVKYIMNTAARYGLSHLPKKVYALAAKLVLINHMKPNEAVELYNKYIGDWGSDSTTYTFQAIKNGEVVKTVIKEPMKKVYLEVKADHTDLVEKNTYDMAAVRIRAIDQNGNLLNFYNDPLVLEASGDIEIVGPKVISLNGGMGGTYVRTVRGSDKSGKLTVISTTDRKEINFNVKNN